MVDFLKLVTHKKTSSVNQLQTTLNSPWRTRGGPELNLTPARSGALLEFDVNKLKKKKKKLVLFHLIGVT